MSQADFAPYAAPVPAPVPVPSPAPVAVTLGEPAGIGPELVLAAWLRRRAADGPGPGRFFLIDDPARVAALAARLGLEVPVRTLTAPAAGAGSPGLAEQVAAAFDRALPVLPPATPLGSAVTPGRPDPAHGPAVIGAIAQAVGLVGRGQAAAVVTNPIHKATLYRCGFRFPGHTEYLAELASQAPFVADSPIALPAPSGAAAAAGATPATPPGPAVRPVMMLAVPGLRVVPVTVHLSLRDAIARLDTSEIVAIGRVTARALALDFGLERPRLAVAALNPHAGEDGAWGDEEARIITPAVAALRAEGIAVSGPHPPDTLFHPAARATYDAVLCMYHDQALIPLKTLDFAHGVNLTLGLPFIRTSPDHGTALDLAGHGCADPASLCAALAAAAELSARRAARGSGLQTSPTGPIPVGPLHPLAPMSST